MYWPSIKTPSRYIFTKRVNRVEDKKIFFETAHSFRDRLVKIARIKLGNHFDAEDAVEDVILKAYEKRSQLADSSKLYPWLKSILVNYCNDIFRTGKRFDYSEIGDQSADHGKKFSADPAERAQQIHKLELVLDLLLTVEPEEYAEVLIYYYYRKFDYEMIAEEISVPVGTVKSRLSRAREVLSKNIKDAGIELEDLEAVKNLSEWPDIRFF